MRHVAGLPHVTLLNDTRYESFEQSDDGVDQRDHRRP